MIIYIVFLNDHCDINTCFKKTGMYLLFAGINQSFYIFLHHLAKSKLDNSEFEALNNSLEKNRKIFSDADIFVDFSNWS